MQPTYWDRLPELQLPTLLVTGAQDAKFCALAKRMSALIPRARHVTLPGAGHAAHLEAEAAYVALLSDFLGGEGAAR
jgi:pimeloyl-ACP methyl ester carboxylesterase